MKHSPQSPRLSYQDSYTLLQQLFYLNSGAIAPVPDHRPRFDDTAPMGVRFFRTMVEEGKLENLTLPRTYIARSEVCPVSFMNTDLSESTMCWNNFTGVNFTDADLSDCDLRASLFRDTSFVRATLRNADLRRSRFTACDFTDADMLGAKLTRNQGEQLNLSEQQKAAVDWQDSDGEQPPGA